MIPKNKDLFDLECTIAKDIFEGKDYFWEVLPEIRSYILKLGASLPEDEFDHPSETVWIAKDAKIFDNAYIGQYVILDHGADIRQCAFIREDAIIGKGAVIGNSCEIKNAIVFDKAEIPHFNYVGDSIVGFHGHMGGGALCSNVKSDRKNVVVKDGKEAIDTGRYKVGAAIGDWAEIGCHAVLNPGSIIGRHSNVYPTTSHRGVLAENCIEKSNGSIVEKR